MEFRDLNYLRVVASVGHLGRAAERLGLTQPALTKCIARLEQELAVPLLERTRKGVAVTPCGEHLVRHAEHVDAANTDVRRELTELATGQAGHLRIGTGLVGAQHLLPKACITMLERYPGITLEIVSGNSETLFPALRDRTVDVVIAGIRTKRIPGFRQVYLMHDRVTVITRRDHPLQRAGRLTAAALTDARWAMPGAGTLPAEWLSRRCRDLGLRAPQCAVRTGTLPTLLRIVAESDLLAFQSWSVVERTNDYGALLKPLDINAVTWNRAIGVTTRDHGYRSPAIEKLIDALRAAATQADPHA
jgi:DNA-binding transcriptional LysR family regulator